MKKILLSCLCLTLLLAACGAPQQPAPVSPAANPTSAAPKGAAQSSTAAPTVTPTAAPTEAQPLRVWFDPSVPAELRQGAQFPATLIQTSLPGEAGLKVQIVNDGEQSRWLYALVAPFPILVDNVPLEDLKKAWGGEMAGDFKGQQLLVSASTKAAFEVLWGPASPQFVQVDEESALLDRAWSGVKDDKAAWAIVPFEALQPRWKVLHVDNQSLFDRGLDAAKYPLAVPFGFTGKAEALQALQTAAAGKALLPKTNRDVEKMTVLLMTGVTALVRATGYKMETKGMTYPAGGILDWFKNADLRHISNEISFWKDCPKANPNQTNLQFCSPPEYMELLEYVGANVIEMTGNHLNDYNTGPLEYTLKLYKEKGMPYYAAGMTLEEARSALRIEDHGNKIAFMGCNPVGPDWVWARSDWAGAAPCDFEWMHAEIGRLKEQGYLPVVSFQYHEYYTPEIRPGQRVDFEGMASAGAVIVSGSQAHTPQTFEFLGDSFIHYGLGNLFFDQMDIPVSGTRREFLDRHIFYNGRYMGTELQTAMLEDYARPRPMTTEERDRLLMDMFDYTGWYPVATPVPYIGNPNVGMP